MSVVLVLAVLRVSIMGSILGNNKVEIDMGPVTLEHAWNLKQENTWLSNAGQFTDEERQERGYSIPAMKKNTLYVL